MPYQSKDAEHRAAGKKYPGSIPGSPDQQGSLETARRAGKQIGQKKGAKLTTKKSIEKKAEILKHSADFNGSLNDVDCMKLTGLARNTFYKYKRELKEEQA